MIVNFSVWESPDALREFVYRSPDAEVMRQRRLRQLGETSAAFTFKRLFPPPDAPEEPLPGALADEHSAT